MKSISGKKFAKVLEGHGWTCKRINGSHHIYTKPGNPATISVPIHKNQDLKQGLLRNLMGHAGLTEEDLN
jgi:predicted RNA binding protein YcfA (HicA-like mRNA interferase family)